MCGSTGWRMKVLDEVSAPILAAAHAYQVGCCARRTCQPISTSDAGLLARAPNLLIVSSNGAGFDPVDVEACTGGRVVLVVNQSGGNAQLGGRTRTLRCC